MNPLSKAKQHDAPSSTENTTDERRNGPSTPGAYTDALTPAIHRGNDGKELGRDTVGDATSFAHAELKIYKGYIFY